MKKIGSLIIITLVISGCTSSSKLMQRGRYDAAIEKSVKNLLKNPDKTNEISVLEKSYAVANERNQERISFLKLENNPRNLEELIRLYSQLKYRQSLVRTVLPLKLHERTIDYQYVNYDEEIIAAKNAAADYFYANALNLMKQNTKDAYRQAYKEFVKAKGYSNAYRNVDQMIHQCRFQGISRVLVMIKNHTHLFFDDDFQNRLLTIKPSDLDSEWVEYYFRDLDESIEFDYYAVVNIRLIDVSPDISKSSDRLEKKRIQDGFEYVLDKNGNVVKDSLGNDMKVIKYKEITCAIVETLQQKHCSFEGDIEFISLNPQRLLKEEPVGAGNSFEHKWARAIGDLEALNEETRKSVNSKPVPFPSDNEMIFRTSESMRIAISQAIQRNRYLIK